MLFRRFSFFKIMDDFIYKFHGVSCFDEWLFDDFYFCFPGGKVSLLMVEKGVQEVVTVSFHDKLDVWMVAV